MIRLTVSLRSVDGPFFFESTAARTLERAAASGFGGVDVLIGSAAEAEGLGELAARSGLEIGNLMTGLARQEDGLSLADASTAAAARGRMRGIAEAAASLGAGTVLGVVCSAAPDEYSEQVLLESLAAVRDTGTPTLLEPISRTPGPSTAEEARRLIDLVGGGIGLVFDMFHAYVEEADPLRTIAGCTAHFGLVQLSDSNRRVPDRGELPFAAYAEALAAAGYEGPYAIEAEFHSGDPHGELADALAVCRRIGVTGV